MAFTRSACLLFGLILYVASGERVRQHISLETEADYDEDADDDAPDGEKGGLDAADEAETQDVTNEANADANNDVEGPETADSSPAKENTSSRSSPSHFIDFDKVKTMKKSEIWAMIEDQQAAVKASDAAVTSRQRKHDKESKKLRRKWKAVERKFAKLRAASNADKKDIDKMVRGIKAHKKEIQRLKSLAYKR